VCSLVLCTFLFILRLPRMCLIELHFGAILACTSCNLPPCLGFCGVIGLLGGVVCVLCCLG